MLGKISGPFIEGRVATERRLRLIEKRLERSDIELPAQPVRFEHARWAEGHEPLAGRIGHEVGHIRRQDDSPGVEPGKVGQLQYSIVQDELVAALGDQSERRPRYGMARSPGVPVE